MSNPGSGPNGQPLRSALKTDDQADRTSPLVAANKAVSIAEPDPVTGEDPQPKKQFTAGLGRKLSGRPPLSPRSPAKAALASLASSDDLSSLPEPALTDESPHPSSTHHHHRHRVDRVAEKLLAQVSEWIQHEATKKTSRQRHIKSPSRRKSPVSGQDVSVPAEDDRKRSASRDSSSSEVSLDRLQRIVEDGMAALGLKALPSASPRLVGRKPPVRRRSSRSLQLQRTASSDTDYFDGDVLVPSCEAVLDNSGTVLPSGDHAHEKRKDAYLTFKNEIIRIAHTLRLKGWRRVPLNGGDSIWVERLSGALTNAVYVVRPPAELKSRDGGHDGKRMPTKILLRIYGPQVEHLIDRENELLVLRRLARKKIGPRLLGTFTNGRFEEFFNATTLTAANLCQPETSRQIAKRMRELHDGIELLTEEKDEGPAVWRNWDKWVDKVEVIVRHLDNQLLLPDTASDARKPNGFICGLEWPRFKAMVEKSRQLVIEYYGGRERLREKLAFAHNDTQYGNILRVRPDDEKSPLLQPENEHKQLVVIDFEYAAANTPGLEFANHFTEWTYNYADPVAPFACHTERYPTIEQQRRFIKAYVDHVPRHTYMASPESTPLVTPTAGTPLGTPGIHTASSSSSIVDFMLDARVPPGGWKEQERREQEDSDAQIRELMAEARLWRIANSAQWVAWGIIQAKIPGGLELSPRSAALLGMDGSVASVENQDPVAAATDAAGGDVATTAAAAASSRTDEESAATEFDYLAYAQERAMFFWGDCVLAGLVEKGDLPDHLWDNIKLVDY